MRTKISLYPFIYYSYKQKSFRLQKTASIVAYIAP